MFKNLGRLFSSIRLPRPLIRLGSLSLTAWFLYSQRQQYSIKMAEDQQQIKIGEKPSFKVSAYSDTLYQLRKDLDDFVIITNLEELNTYAKKRILTILENIYSKTSQNGRKLRVMFVEPEDSQTERKLEEKNNLKISRNVIMLIKNKYSDKLESFTIDQLATNRQGLEVYFEPIIASQRNDVKKVIEKLDDNEAVLLYVGDDENSEKLYDSQKRFKLAERSVFQEKKNIKFLFVDKEEQLTALGISDTIPNHYHLILKHSSQSVIEPNLSFNLRNYHIISNIQLYDKQNHRLELDDYIDEVHTFSDNAKKYNLLFNIDKNFIDPDQQQQITVALKNVKKANKNVDISFQINFTDVDASEAWNIQIYNNDKLDESQGKYLKGIRESADLLQMGKHTFRYRLESIPTQESIQTFINNVISGQAHEYFLSQQPKVVKSLHKLTGNSFEKHVLKNDKHHLIFQYSQGCQGCKELAPILVKFHSENANHSIQTHRLSEDNAVKGQIIYPYSPVLLFYKQGWKPNPILIPSQAIMKDTRNLKFYCEILSEIQTVDEQELQKHYFQAANLSWENLPFKLL